MYLILLDKKFNFRILKETISQMEEELSIEKSARILILANISKRNNLFNLISIAETFGFLPFVVGMSNLLSLEDIGQDVSYESCRLSVQKTLKSIVRFRSLVDVRNYLVDRSIPIVSIEITETARSLLNFPFTTAIAFMPGNEGTGLNNKQREVSDSFIYIPQYGDGIESLNVSVATSIVLNLYCQTVSK